MIPRGWHSASNSRVIQSTSGSPRSQHGGGARKMLSQRFRHSGLKLPNLIIGGFLKSTSFFGVCNIGIIITGEIKIGLKILWIAIFCLDDHEQQLSSSSHIPEWIILYRHHFGLMRFCVRLTTCQRLNWFVIKKIDLQFLFFVCFYPRESSRKRNKEEKMMNTPTFIFSLVRFRSFIIFHSRVITHMY